MEYCNNKHPVTLPQLRKLLRNWDQLHQFTTTLEGKLIAGIVEIAPSGEIIFGRVIKSQKGSIKPSKSILELTLTAIMIHGQLKPIKTKNLTGEGSAGAPCEKSPTAPYLVR